MITLSVIVVLYAIIGSWIFKKRYGHLYIIDDEPALWKFLLIMCIMASFIIVIVGCVKYLP